MQYIVLMNVLESAGHLHFSQNSNMMFQTCFDLEHMTADALGTYEAEYK